MSKLLPNPSVGYTKPQDESTPGLYPNTIVEAVYWDEKDKSLADTLKELENGGSGVEKVANKVTTISADSTDVQYPSAKAVYTAIQEGGGGSSAIPVEYEMPQGGFLPNVYYELGDISSATTFSLAQGEQGVLNHYYWTFNIGSSAPLIAWPSGLQWAWGSEPELRAYQHYEVSVIENYAFFVEMPSGYTPPA